MQDESVLQVSRRGTGLAGISVRSSRHANFCPLMFYCFVNPRDIADGVITVTGENFYHLKTVLHARPGEKIRVRSDRFVYDAVLATVGTDRVTATIASTREAGPGTSRKLILGLGLIQEKNFDLAVRQAVQLGVSEIRPLLTRNVADHRLKTGRRERWEKIVLSAAMQSQRLEVPAIAEIASFEDAVTGYASAGTIRLVMPYELEESRIIESSLFEAGGDIVVLIGPEGGWSPDEASFGRDHGAVTVSLGPNILRAETAALVSLTLISRCLGLL